jgi:hypothetical protein
LCSANSSNKSCSPCAVSCSSTCRKVARRRERSSMGNQRACADDANETRARRRGVKRSPDFDAVLSSPTSAPHGFCIWSTTRGVKPRLLPSRDGLLSSEEPLDFILMWTMLQVRRVYLWTASERHPDQSRADGTGGHFLRAVADLPPDSVICTLPFSAAITPSVARAALASTCRDHDALDPLNERQVICTYLAMHWVLLGYTRYRYSP